MKLILIIGASVSSAAMAAGFAVLADQAIPRDRVAAEAAPRAALAAREAPLLTPELAAVIRHEAPRIAIAHPAAPADAAGDREYMYLLPPAATATIAGGLSERPPRPTRTIAEMEPSFAGAGIPSGLDTIDRTTGSAGHADPIMLSRIQNLPLIGVYR